MLREIAASPDYLPPVNLNLIEDSPQSESEEIFWLRSIVHDYLNISHEGTLSPDHMTAEDHTLLLQHDSQLIISFSGRLRQDADKTQDELDNLLAKRDFYALLRANPSFRRAPHVIHIVKGRPEKPKAWSVWPNLLLFILTILSVLYAGTLTAIGELSLVAPKEAETLFSIYDTLAIVPEIWRGWPYALAILLILGAHEMGHFLMMRYHKVHATWPYFLPSLPPIGTLGAAIALREPLKNRKILLDVGAAGPIAGFLVTLPILVIGLATSQVLEIQAGNVEGNSLLYYMAKFIVFGEVMPSLSHDVYINQLAFAGWTGLFFTAFNLFPLGQLDGGHVMYALFGPRARLAYIPVLLAFVTLIIATQSMVWLLFFGLLLFFGRVYAVPLNDISPLDSQRKMIGIIALIIFALCFTPVPFWYREGTSIGGETVMQWGMMGITMLLSLRRKFA